MLMDHSLCHPSVHPNAAPHARRDLVAYWKFDEPSDMDPDGRPLPHMVAKDASGNGNSPHSKSKPCSVSLSVTRCVILTCVTSSMVPLISTNSATVTRI